ncbi:MAG: hypothetical protein ACLQDL_02945 [Spirochaetia bacterium]
MIPICHTGAVSFGNVRSGFVKTLGVEEAGGAAPGTPDAGAGGVGCTGGDAEFACGDAVPWENAEGSAMRHRKPSTAEVLIR